MKKILNKKIKGAAAYEHIILTPLILVTLITLLYFFLIVMSHIQFNNLANVVAQDLNMIEEGFQISNEIPVLEYRNTSNLNDSSTKFWGDYFREFFSEKGEAFQPVLEVQGRDSNLIKGLNYSISKHEDRFYMTGVNVKRIEVIFANDGRPLSVPQKGEVIEVVIRYTIFNLKMTAHGYAVRI